MRVGVCHLILVYSRCCQGFMVVYWISWQATLRKAEVKPTLITLQPLTGTAQHVGPHKWPPLQRLTLNSLLVADPESNLVQGRFG
ncbi:hypothetical protein AOLI_G00159550 [Acnodon oligacanthus]